MAKDDDHEARILELENAFSQIAKIAVAVERHDETIELHDDVIKRHEFILKGGDRADEMGLLERVRRIEGSIDTAAGWLRAITMLFLAQFVAVIFGVVAFFIKIAPALIELQK